MKAKRDLNDEGRTLTGAHRAPTTCAGTAAGEAMGPTMLCISASWRRARMRVLLTKGGEWKSHKTSNIRALCDASWNEADSC